MKCQKNVNNSLDVVETSSKTIIVFRVTYQRVLNN